MTAGVALEAHADRLDDPFISLYILPGVALDTSSHVEREGSREVVLPWRRFQHVASDMCRLAGTTVFFTTNREDFSRRLFVEHLSSPGERPNVRGIRSTFARSLKLNKDVTDLNETLRDHLIEPRPTNVRQFRARLDQFRAVRELIRQIKARIEEVTKVTKGYAVVQQQRTAQANLECLRAVYDTERVGEQLNENEERRSGLAVGLESAQFALGRAETEMREAGAARERALTARSQDPDFQKQAGHAERLSDLESGLEAAQGTLTTALQAAIAATAAAGKLPALANQQAAFEDGITQLLALQDVAKTGQVPPPEAVLAVSQVLASCHEQTRRSLALAEADLRAAKDQQRDAKTALERTARPHPAPGTDPDLAASVEGRRHPGNAGVRSGHRDRSGLAASA